MTKKEGRKDEGMIRFWVSLLYRDQQLISISFPELDSSRSRLDTAGIL